MKDLFLVRPRYFYLLFLPFIIGLFVVVFFTEKSTLFLFTNKYHSSFADQFFFWVTWLGNGLVFFLICLWVLFKNWGKGILGFSCFALSALLPQFLKKVVFTHSLRPVKYFEGNNTLHLIQGYEHHHYHSFPSGHAASIFALALFLTLIAKDKRWGILFSAIAILTAYSRVYLAQHFLEDIFAGSLIGFFSTLFIFICMEKWIKGKKKLDSGILR